MGQIKKTSKKVTLVLAVLFLVTATFTPLFNGYLTSEKEGFSYSLIENTELIVSFLDVGQGDATLILSEDETILIDTGLYKNYDKLLLALSKFDIETIDTLILTHPDTDHFGSANIVVSEFLVSRVIVNSMFADSAYFSDLSIAVDENGGEVSVIEEDKISLGNAEINLVSFDYSEDNDNSIVSYIDIFNFDLLLTADISKSVESDIISYFNISDVAVLKAAHHGSNSSTGEEIIAAANPEYCVISVGENSFGHPSGEVLSRLRDRQVLRTDKNGSITFYISKDEIALSVEE